MSCCLTNPFSLLSAAILTAPHLSFQLFFFSPAWLLSLSAPPRDAVEPTLAQLNFHNTRVRRTRAASFKSLYRTRARAPCSPHHSSVDARIRYSAKTYRDLLLFFLDHDFQLAFTHRFFSYLQTGYIPQYIRTHQETIGMQSPSIKD